MRVLLMFFSERMGAVLYWAFSTLVIVFGVKYYTSIEMRKLERRLTKVKDDLTRAKEKLQTAQETQKVEEAEEEHTENRVRSMKEIIADIQARLQAQAEPEEA